MVDEKACEDGRTLEAENDMVQCIHCERQVRWDLVDHPFFGFKAGCPEGKALP